MIPPLAATYVNRLDNKQGVQKPGNVTKYALLPFTSSARSDGLVLKHWRRVKTAKGADYEFAKFNNSTRMVVYTMVEWDTLKLESAETLNGKVWTKEETDYLLYLCHHFGLRWPVIADRYDYSSSSSSSSSPRSCSRSRSRQRCSSSPSRTGTLSRPRSLPRTPTTRAPRPRSSPRRGTSSGKIAPPRAPHTSRARRRPAASAPAACAACCRTST